MSADAIADADPPWPHHGLLFDSVPFGVLYQDAQGAVVSANPAARRVLARGRDADPGEPLRSLGGRAAVWEDGSPLADEDEPAAIALRTGAPVGERLLGLPNPGRERRTWIRVRAVPVPGADGQGVAGVYTLIEDVSAQHYAAALAREHLRAASRPERPADAARPQLRARASTLRRILDHLPIAVAAVSLDAVSPDADPRIVFSNQEFRRTFGYTPAEIPTLADWVRLAHADEPSRAAALADWTRALTLAAGGQGQVPPREYRITCKDGGVREVILSASIIDDLMLCSLVDITQRKQAEAEVAEVSHFLRTLIDAIPSPIFYKDRAGRYQGVNRAFEETTGLRREDVIGHTVHDFCAPELAAVYQAADERLLAEQGTQVYEARVAQADGVVHDVVFYKAVYFDTRGVLAGMVGVSLDISGQKRIEAELGASEAKYRSLVENIPGVVWSSDATGDMFYISPNCSAVLGYTPEEMQGAGGKERFFGCIHPEDVQRVKDAYTALFQDHKSYDVEYRIRRLDGDWLWVRDKSAAAYPRDGRLVADGIATDITVSKRYELAIQEARDAAQAANAAKGEFLAHMSHEIRTPLNAVLGLAQVLERTPLTDPQRDMVERIGIAGRSLLAILGDILDLSKIEAGQLRIESAPFDLAALLSRIASLMGQTARAKGLELRVVAPAGLTGLLVGDALRLEQVLVNLTGNAIKFTAEGEVALRAGILEQGDESVRLHFAVSDTGIGIAPAERARLFTPFTQAETGIARRFGGTGLGLAISKRLVELMQGRIGVESEPGHGSTFWFEVPFARATAGLPVPVEVYNAPVPAGPRLAHTHLLVVDDSAMNRDLVERALSLEGASVSLAADGQQAVTLLRARPDHYDAVLMDVRMPVMDGLTATRIIRGELGLTTLPVIALTAGVLAGEQEAARAAGVDAVLPKPLDIGHMTETLAHWIGRAQAGANASDGAAAGQSPGAGGSLGADSFPEIPGIDPARVVATCGRDLSFFLRLLGGFCAEFAAAPAQTRADLARGERETAARRMHTLRGNAASLGALEPARAAGALETAIERGETDLELQLADLEETLTTLTEATAPWREAAAEAVGQGG